MRTLSFDQILDTIETLSPDEQEVMVELIQKRLIERRRAEIAANITNARAEHRTGQVFRGTVNDVIAELNN